MSKFEKAKQRILSLPTDYTYNELKSLLEKLGYQERQKGNTSGSKVLFYREKDKATIQLHKPHPSNIVKEYAVKDVVETLKTRGEL